MFLSYGKQSINNSDIKSVIKTLKSNYLTQGPEVEKFEADSVDLHVTSKGAVCFSKDGSYYKLTGQLDNNDNIFIEDKSTAKKDYIIICSKSDSVKNLCPSTDKIKKDQPLYLIAWSRFGMINKFKWDYRSKEWKRN